MSSSFDKKFDSMKIPLRDLETATNNFADENLIRHDGSSKIYKGRLSRSGKLIDIVARKFMSWRGQKELRMEVMMLCTLKHHQNVVSIVGFCDENDEKIIVNKFEVKGSLDRYLSDPFTLRWTQRLQICLGIARALSCMYHYEGRNWSVIHGNIKSSKILLDDNWEAKLSGFDLSKMQAANRRHLPVLDREIRGTYAYIDPAYITSGAVVHKSDLYSFGVVLFEVLCGRKAFAAIQSPPPAPSFGDLDQILENEDRVKTDNQNGVNILFSGHSTSVNEFPLVYAPSLNDLREVMASWNNAPSISGIEPREKSGSFNGYQGRSYDDFSEMAYMITTKRLDGLHITEDGLLATLARSHYENKTLDDIIHPGLLKQMDPESLKRFSEAAYFCLNEQPTQRPNIGQVVTTLERALELQIQHENSERSTVAVEDTSNNHLKWKDLEHLKIRLCAIKSATDDFSAKYLIGEGGFGWVYKAELEHFDFTAPKGNSDSELPKRRSPVAIKDIKNRDGTQGFILEIETLSRCKHDNIVSLLGFCDEDSRMILVYELVSNGSLEHYLGNEENMTNLTWVQRLKICIDVARGLEYIHSTSDNKRKIIHRDIKSANILLNENWKAKIADFGLSMFQPLNHPSSTINLSKLAGTELYLDPEYARTGNLKKESDVYSFGVVLFEILTGKLTHDWESKDNDKGLVPIVKQHFESKGTLMEMVDSKLKEESDGKGFSLSKGPNKDSVRIFSQIGFQCLSDNPKHRPTIKGVIKHLEDALKSQKTNRDGLRISLEDIKQATEDFSFENVIGMGGFGKVYRGKILHDNEPTLIAVKRNNEHSMQGEYEFLTELQILFEYKHKNIISLLGYCNESKERISVFEYASNGSLDMHLKDASLTWTKRLKIAIDVATGLDFLHGGGTTQASVIHRDIKCGNILLNGDWTAKIADFGLSMITAIDNEMEFAVDDVCGTVGYVDPQYVEQGLFMRGSDIYSLGVVLLEMMFGSNIYSLRHKDPFHWFRCPHEEGKLDALVYEDIKDQIVPKSLIAYQNIILQCLHNEGEKRPKASEVVLQLEKALELQEDIEIWGAKLPTDYKEIIHMSNTPEDYTNLSNKVLCETFSKGILLPKGKVFFSLSSNGGRNEMVSATMFGYENNRLHNKRISTQDSRFQRVVKIMDILNLKIQINIKTQFLFPKVIYGAHLIFKFCDPKKVSSKLMYVNLKYQMGGETLHAYFATCGDDEWMMIELFRFIPHKKDVRFEVLLESMSRYYCGNGGIYVEGIRFQAVNDETLKGVQRLLKSNSDSEQQVPVDYDEITQLEDGEKLFSLSQVNDKKCHMLPAKMVLYNTSEVNCFNWKSLAELESRFLEAAELLSEQVIRIKCKIETQKLSVDTDYACYLVFKLSQQCHGLQCPVKVQDVLLRKNKELKFLYFRYPRIVNLHASGRVPKHREDGLMEVIVWEFNSGNKPSDDNLPISLKLRCYEGTMTGLVVYGIEFRPI